MIKLLCGEASRDAFELGMPESILLHGQEDVFSVFQDCSRHGGYKIDLFVKLLVLSFEILIVNSQSLQGYLCNNEVLGKKSSGCSLATLKEFHYANLRVLTNVKRPEHVCRVVYWE